MHAPTSICYYIESGPLPKKPKLLRAVATYYLTVAIAIPLLPFTWLNPKRSKRIGELLAEFIRKVNEDKS